MQLPITAEELIAAFRRDWPAEFEITTLREANRTLAERITELEAAMGGEHDGGSARFNNHPDQPVV